MFIRGLTRKGQAADVYIRSYHTTIAVLEVIMDRSTRAKMKKKQPLSALYLYSMVPVLQLEVARVGTCHKVVSMLQQSSTPQSDNSQSDKRRQTLVEPLNK